MLGGMRNAYYIMDYDTRQTWGVSPVTLAGIAVAAVVFMQIVNQFVI